MRAASQFTLALAVLVSAPAMAVDLGSVTLPLTYTYADTFASAASLTPFSGTYKGATYNFNFSDDITFTVPNAVGSNVATTINLGSLFNIDNFQARLYSGATVGTGVPSGSVLESWGTQFNASGFTVSSAVLAPIGLTAGQYTLNIRGLVTGLAGGSYSGVLNIASSVPEPGTWASVMAGLAVLGLSLRRRVG